MKLRGVSDFLTVEASRGVLGRRTHCVLALTRMGLGAFRDELMARVHGRGLAVIVL